MKMATKRLWWQEEDDGDWWCIDYIEMPQGLQFTSNPYLAYGGDYAVKREGV